MDDAAGGLEIALVVEDEKPIQRIVEKFLLREGYQAIVYESGEEALQYEGTARVVFVDFNLPGMNGKEFLKQYLTRHPTTRAVLMTGGDESQRTSDNEAPTLYLEKPFTVSSFLEVLPPRVKRL